jgi:hypothetical protein
VIPIDHKVDDVDCSNMGPAQQKRFYKNIKWVAMLIASSTGNVLIHCRNGRSRSPMFLVAYLMIFHQLSFQESRSMVAGELWIARRLSYDRFDRFEAFLRFLDVNQILTEFIPVV